MSPKEQVEPVYEHAEPIVFWQSYASSPNAGMHSWADSDTEYKIERLRDVHKKFRSGFAFIQDGRLIFEDLANGGKYRMEKNGQYKKLSEDIQRTAFEKNGFTFSFDYPEAAIKACSASNDDCVGISVATGSFPYVYAEHDGSVIAITNWGDAVMFQDGEWCRMTMVDDVYSCADPKTGPLLEPRRIQFYSSIRYQGRTLVGEWPTGRLYEFDGTTLRPSDLTPPGITALASQRLGYEAQSMAMYCGDLFVGYWPKGEIYRYDATHGLWSLFSRVFTGHKEESFIPYLDRVPDDNDQAFFGQRVTALVPYEDSLYVATSNLRSWHEGVSGEPLPRRRIRQYGAIYKISKPFCKSTYH